MPSRLKVSSTMTAPGGQTNKINTFCPLRLNTVVIITIHGFTEDAGLCILFDSLHRQTAPCGTMNGNDEFNTMLKQRGRIITALSGQSEMYIEKY
jgi:hypothetical protein